MTKRIESPPAGYEPDLIANLINLALISGDLNPGSPITEDSIQQLIASETGQKLIRILEEILTEELSGESLSNAIRRIHSEISLLDLTEPKGVIDLLAKLTGDNPDMIPATNLNQVDRDELFPILKKVALKRFS